MHLTPAAVGYLTQFILVSVIVVFFAYHALSRKRPGKRAHTGLLTCFFSATTAFILELFLESASPPARRLPVVYLENTTTGLILIFLLQFAYHFPDLPPKRKWEARTALGLSVLYTLLEAGFAAYRFTELSKGLVHFRPPWADYALVLGFLWVPVVFVRQAVRASRRDLDAVEQSTDWSDLSVVDHLWRPHGQTARAARGFTLVYLLPVGMSAANLLRSYRLIPAGLYHASLSVGLLCALFFFAITYLNSLPETTTFMVKLVGATLVALLAVLGLGGWEITLAQAENYREPSLEGQTLRFTPNDRGGFDVATAPFWFDRDLGIDLGLADTLEETKSVALDFAFPFYGQMYDQVYVMNDGVIGLGRPVDHRTIQYHYGVAPAIFPLYVDLIPQSGEGGIFARQEADRLVITWYRVPAFHAQETTYTFQLVLHQDGTFEVTYDDIPPELTFQPDSDPEDGVWLVGAVPGHPEPGLPPQGANLVNLPVASGPQGVVLDYYLDFRQYLHTLLLPLVRLIAISSLAILIGFPLLFYMSLVRPLNALLHGVRRLEAGDYTVSMPVKYSDEIGFLTRAFNALAAQLGDLIHNLETRVAERTETLGQVNTRLRAEIEEREQAQATIIEQQRALARLEERERLGRELHDGLGQMMGYINVQAQTVETLLADGRVKPAQANLRRIVETAQQTHADIRGYILGLRTADTSHQSFWETLRDCLHQFETTCGIETGLNLPAGAPLPAFGPAVEEHLLHIVQEALANAHKHATAQRVEVLFNFADTATHIIIADDGIGFEPPPYIPFYGGRDEEEPHFGLQMMHERAETVGGQVEIRSAPGEGTCVIIHVPRLLTVPDGEAETSVLSGLRLLLVDDHPLFLEGLHNLLAARGFTVVGEAHDGEAALRQARALRPDVVIMDVHMPGDGGLQATRAIKAELPEVKIVMLTVAEDDAHLFEAIKSGAAGYLLKSLDANQFCTLLTGVLNGDVPLAPGMAARIMAEFVRSASPSSVEGASSGEDMPPDEEASFAGTRKTLTPRQEDILRFVVRGLTYKEIGQRLHLSEKTIKYHMARIVERLQVENRTQAIAHYLATQN